MNDINRPNLNTVTDSKRIICTPSYFAKSTLFYIQEIGRLKSLKPHRSSRKALRSYLYIAVLHGTGILTYDGKTYKLKEGDQIFIDCKQPYYHESDEMDPWELVWIHFNGVNMERFYMYFINKFDSILLHTLDLRTSVSIYEKLMDLAGIKNNNAELQISALLYELMTNILISDKNNVSSPVVEKMERIKGYIDSHYNDKITLDLLAEQFFISKYHMAREFKRHYGTSIIHYSVSQKITKSKELLRYSGMQIDEIAREVGVEDNSYFNKVFQKMEGMTAREYRRQWRNK